MKKDEFYSAIQSLKLYRRAELIDEKGRGLIKELYADPLPENHILKTVLSPHSTFLIGRKGTGKSTIFQRVQEDLNNKPDSTWAYIDIKTLYESSTSDLAASLQIPDNSKSLSKDVIKRTYIFRSFVIELIKEIKKQIEARINTSLVSRIKGFFTLSTAELFENLDALMAELSDDKYINITSMLEMSSEETQGEKSGIKVAAGLKGKAGSMSSLEASVLFEILSELSKSSDKQYSEAFLRIFNIREIITKLKDILTELKLKHLYVFIDDFSELPREALETIVDTILVPFNNWSEEFIKLKVAVYPGRMYFGDLDRSKLDEVYLDIYQAYGSSDINAMEEKAIDFTKRLIEKRIAYYCKTSVDEYFDSTDDTLWRVLFYASMANPRILGYILFFCYENNIIYNKKIGIKTIQESARRYYEEKIESYFTLNKFLHETFDERSSIYSLKELLEEIVKRAKQLRSYAESSIMREIEGRPPTSHFHVITAYDSILSTLELNFFLTKYYVMKDRKGNKVSIYALNYGLCQQQAISFGRPREKREHRLYFVETIFNYAPIVASYIKVNQEIVCENCGEKHEPEKLPSLKIYDMQCPSCNKGKCKIVNLSRKYEKLLIDVSPDVLLPQTELGMLKTLHDERKDMFAKEIASDLDCSYQLVGRRGKNLSDMSLVDRSENEHGRRVFKINELAEDIYFKKTKEDEMDFILEGEEPAEQEKTDL